MSTAQMSSKFLTRFGALALTMGKIIHEPLDNLTTLSEAHDAGLAALFAAADAEDLFVLGSGIQPKTPASLELMTERPRYVFMHELMGYGWRLFSATASDQVSSLVGW